MNQITKVLSLLVLLTALSFGQLTTPSTTLSSAITATQNTITLASGTGVVVPSQTVAGTILYVDTEAMQVQSSPASAVFVVKRGVLGTKQTTHASSALVWVTQPATGTGDLSRPFSNGALIKGTPTGTCTASAQYTLPLINQDNGAVIQCWSGFWQVVNATAPASVLGTAVASAATITPTAHTFHVTGTTQINTINVPTGFAPGGCFTLIPDGIFSTGTSGNIALGSTAVVSKILRECWDGSKFFPSY